MNRSIQDIGGDGSQVDGDGGLAHPAFLVENDVNSHEGPPVCFAQHVGYFGLVSLMLTASPLPPRSTRFGGDSFLVHASLNFTLAPQARDVSHLTAVK